MSKKGGDILCDLWSRVDQADFDTMITEAFKKIPTKIQKKFIAEILENNIWDLNGKPDDRTLSECWEFVDAGEDTR
jgi:hypothetical protein